MATTGSMTGTQNPKKLFIQMSGAPGSGKSTIARLLQQSIGGLVIDHDMIRSSLLSDLPFNQAAKAAYRLQWTLAEEVVKQGLNVIVDSTCNSPEAVEHGSEIAGRYEFGYWYVECRVDDIEVLDERLKTRKPLRSQRTGVEEAPVDVEATRKGEEERLVFRRWMNPSRPDGNVIVVDSTQEAEKCRDYILEQINKTTPQNVL